MIELFTYKVILTGLLASALLFILNKWGVINYVQTYAKSRMIVRMFNCNFCLGFWLSFIICLFGLMIESSFIWLAVPFFSVSIVRLID